MELGQNYYSYDYHGHKIYLPSGRSIYSHNLPVYNNEDIVKVNIPSTTSVEQAAEIVKDVEGHLKDIDGFKEYTDRKIKINYWIKHVLQTFMALCSIGAFIYANISGILSISGDDIGYTIAAYVLVFGTWLAISAVILIPVWSKYD